MIRYSKRHRRKSSALPEITLTPLIDTALTLLIIFMVTTPMMQNAIKVELPQGQAQEDGGVQQELVVHIDKDATLFFNGKPITQANLIQEIQKNIKKNTDKTVFVKADQSVQYGNVIKIVDQIKVVGGVRYVALATKKLA